MAVPGNVLVQAGVQAVYPSRERVDPGTEAGIEPIDSGAEAGTERVDPGSELAVGTLEGVRGVRKPSYVSHPTEDL